MHELSIAQNILDAVDEHVLVDHRYRVKRITVKVGDQAGVVPESLEFCFRSLVDGTDLSHAALTIERVPFMVKCRSCGRSSINEGGLFFCSVCGGTDVELITGNELQICSIEILDEENAQV